MSICIVTAEVHRALTQPGHKTLDECTMALVIVAQDKAPKVEWAVTYRYFFTGANECKNFQSYGEARKFFRACCKLGEFLLPANFDEVQ